MELTNMRLYMVQRNSWECAQIGEGLAHYASELMLRRQPYTSIACCHAC